MLSYFKRCSLQVAIVWLRRDTRGVTALEYGLIAALIAVVIVSSLTGVGSKLTSTFVLLTGKV